MKNLKSTIVLTLIVSAGLLLAPTAFAQMGMDRCMQMPKYDPTTAITIKEIVQEVQRTPAGYRFAVEIYRTTATAILKNRYLEVNLPKRSGKI